MNADALKAVYNAVDWQKKIQLIFCMKTFIFASLYFDSCFVWAMLVEENYFTIENVLCRLHS